MAHVEYLYDRKREKDIEDFITSLVNKKTPYQNEQQFYQRLFENLNRRQGTYRPTDQVGREMALQIYNKYSFRINQLYRREERDRRRLVRDEQVPYPFKTKQSKFLKEYPDTLREATPHDTMIDMKKYVKPSFSKYHGTWEIDVVFGLLDRNADTRKQSAHLFCINVNTRYLVVYQIPNKDADSIGAALRHLVETVPVHYLRGDGERAFVDRETVRWLSEHGIPPDHLYFTSSKFTYHSKIVDVAIKTIRNAIGYRIIDQHQLQQIIWYYNRTYHKGIDCTPLEMMQHRDENGNKDWEDQYIRYCMKRLVKARQQEEFDGLLDYEYGNVLLLHFDLKKTALRDEKRRKFWDRVGIFIRYENRNVVVRLLGAEIKGGGGKLSRDERGVPIVDDHGTYYEYVLPIQFTKLIAKNINEVPEYYRNYYTF
jgi:hypothetical protein